MPGPPDMAVFFEGLAQDRPGAMYADPDILRRRSGHLGDFLVASMLELAQEDYRLKGRLKGPDEFGDAIAHLPARRDLVGPAPRAIVDQVLEGPRLVQVLAIGGESIALEIHALLLSATELVGGQVPDDSVQPFREGSLFAKTADSRQSPREGFLHQVFLDGFSGQSGRIALEGRA